MKSPLTSLFSPQIIGGITFPNRIVGAPTVTQLAYPDGTVSTPMLALYTERAKGGLGLLTVELAAIHPTGKALRYQLGAWDDRFIPGLRKLSDVIHHFNVPCSLQVGHCGRQTSRETIGTRPVAPSALSQFPRGHRHYLLPRALSGDEVQQIISLTIAAALRALHAGFDAVELHAAHGYLFQQFLSPASNKRDDEFGGSIANRCRILTLIINGIRDIAGDKLAILCKIDGEEYIPGGIDGAEAAQISPYLEAAGADALIVAAGCHFSIQHLLPPAYMESMPNLESAMRMKQAVRIPVGVVGKIDDFALADKAIHDQQVDFIGLARPLLCDPALPEKLRQARESDIRHCIFCNQKCNAIDDQYIVGCTLNPALVPPGEDNLSTRKPPTSKRVAVIGAGPAGLEVARSASLLGHVILIIDKEPQIGGQVNLITKIPGKTSWVSIIEYYKHCLAHDNIEVALGEKVSMSALEKFSPDAVIIATGATATGRTLQSTADARVINAFEAIEQPDSIGPNVVVIGGQRLAIDTAILLASHGKQITLLVRGPDEDYLTQTLQQTRRRHALDMLALYQVQIRYGISVSHIDREHLAMDDSGKAGFLPYETAVIATSMKPVLPEFVSKIRDAYPRTFLIGDCVQARGIGDAILEGYKVSSIL